MNAHTKKKTQRKYKQHTDKQQNEDVDKTKKQIWRIRRLDNITEKTKTHEADKGNDNEENEW